MRAAVVFAALAGTLMVVATGCGDTSELQKLDFRIYDPAGDVRTEITGSDIVRSSAQAVPQEEGYASVTFTFTPTGSSKFCRLTRALARRGAAARKRQRFAVAINGRERRPFIDYEATPDGLCGSPGVQLDGMPLAEALELAELIRGGSTR